MAKEGKSLADVVKASIQQGVDSVSKRKAELEKKRAEIDAEIASLDSELRTAITEAASSLGISLSAPKGKKAKGSGQGSGSRTFACEKCGKVFGPGKGSRKAREEHQKDCKASGVA